MHVQNDIRRKSDQKERMNAHVIEEITTHHFHEKREIQKNNSSDEADGNDLALIDKGIQAVQVVLGNLDSYLEKVGCPNLIDGVDHQQKNKVEIADHGKFGDGLVRKKVFDEHIVSITREPK